MKIRIEICCNNKINVLIFLGILYFFVVKSYLKVLNVWFFIFLVNKIKLKYKFFFEKNKFLIYVWKFFLKKLFIFIYSVI